MAAVKSLASALSIGSGAAVGREGPIIQIGATLGSTAGQLIRMETWQRITLVAAGAGAGIAATFNTPLGGVMFAIELMMPEVSVRTFLPVALATGTATFIGRLFLGVRPAFDVPEKLVPERGARFAARRCCCVPCSARCAAWPLRRSFAACMPARSSSSGSLIPTCDTRSAWPSSAR